MFSAVLRLVVRLTSLDAANRPSCKEVIDNTPWLKCHVHQNEVIPKVSYHQLQLLFLLFCCSIGDREQPSLADVLSVRSGAVHQVTGARSITLCVSKILET